MTLSRRNLLRTVAALPVLGAIYPKETHAMSGLRTTIILSPHPDDEVISLAHYITFAADRGDRMILVQATDGAATHVGRDLGLTPSETTTWRYREQNHAWDWLAQSGGQIVRPGFPDGGLEVQPLLRELRGLIFNDSTEVYVSTWHHDRPGAVQSDQHPDHMACVEAARALQAEGVTVRYAVHPLSNLPRAIRYRGQGAQLLRIQGAVDSYRVIGRRSTANLGLVLDGQSRVTW